MLRIGHELRRGIGQAEVRSPWDQSLVGEVTLAGADDMDRAIETAASAFATFKKVPAWRRSETLTRTAALLSRDREAVARRMVQEGGKPIRYALAEVDRAILTLTLGAHEALRLGGEVLRSDIEPRGEDRLSFTVRVPRGPIAAISPFNFPLNLVAHKLSPAVAVGASVVCKPAAQCPLTALALADLLLEAGLPAEALSVLPCAPDVAERMVRDDRLKVLSFTGSDAVGWHLKAIAGKKTVILELGGNAACIVDETADLDAAANAVALAAFAQAGQVCIKVQRVLAVRSIFDALLAKIVTATAALVCGDPMDPATVVGPLIEARHVERITEWTAEAKAGGATEILRGEVTGQLMRPSILTGVPDQARLCRDEVFGPVLCVEAVGSFGDALVRANASRFGLQAGVFTRNITRALKALDVLEVGGVLINDAPNFRLDNAPYGGTKDSGLGREGLAAGVQELTETKLCVMR